LYLYWFYAGKSGVSGWKEGNSGGFAQ